MTTSSVIECRIGMPLLNIDNLETPWTPASEEDFTKVRRQLERILEDPHFRGSKRYTRFLHFIVEEALSGNSGGIKERSLGIAVFDRPLDYDTYSDSIVRVAASEVRKRIAQYYDTPGHDHELRIGLPLGSYTPEFRLGRRHASGATTVHADNVLRALESGLASGTEDVSKKGESQAGRLLNRRTSIYLLILAAACVSAALLGRVALRTPKETNALSALWGPVVEKTDSVVICVGQVSSQTPRATAESTQVATPTETGFLPDILLVRDAASASQVSAVLGRMGGNPRVLGAASTNFTDLQITSGVFIGAFNNPWTLRLQEPLRYQFVRNATDQTYDIVDTKHPDSRLYQIDKTKPYSQSTQDYGIVARFLSPTTERETVIIAGIGANGTLAATSMATDERFFGALVRSAGKNAATKNIEILVTTQIIDNHTGPPKVLDVQYW
jgi:hypothetical protein